MKKSLIGALVGALLLFGWQSVSWMFLPFHDAAFQRVSNQDSVITALANLFPQEGQYMVPQAAPGATQEDASKFMEARTGKPWAIVSFHPSLKNNMAGAMTRGFLIALACAALAAWVIQRKTSVSFLDGFLTSLLLAAICFLYVWYNQHNWFETPWSVLKGEAYDLFMAWGLNGIWMGWWFSKK